MRREKYAVMEFLPYPEPDDVDDISLELFKGGIEINPGPNYKMNGFSESRRVFRAIKRKMQEKCKGKGHIVVTRDPITNKKILIRVSPAVADVEVQPDSDESD
jgi:hypothetical protein